MIKQHKDIIKLDTEHTTLLLRIREVYVELLHYGRRIPDGEDYTVFGTALHIDPSAGCDDHITARLMYSCNGMGNSTESLVIVKNADGSYVNRFTFTGFSVTEPDDPADMPHARNKAECAVLRLEDSHASLALEVVFSLFSDSDVIAVKTRLINCGEIPVTVLRLMSLQLDLISDRYELMTFDGSWARERHLHVREVRAGIAVNESKGGSSSNVHNPFIMLRRRERLKEAYAFNLIYSGNHKEVVEVTPDRRTRVLVGINDYLFEHTLAGGDAFESPEAVMLWGEDEDALTHGMHGFVSNHIVDPQFARAPRPVLFNNWEGTYFDFDRSKLTAMLGPAKEVGVELFVLDDGWFGRRNDDRSSLGDWNVENPKIEGGLAVFAALVKQSGLKFGLWMEPEMISADSDLCRAHPEYVMRNHRPPLERRNQLMLDLTNPAVCAHLIRTISEVTDKYSLDYIKWDYNRNMSDMFGSTLDSQGDYFHRYICGLYKILTALKRRYPNLLIEACASGGNRFDLGILFYMPQVWASDNTDAYDRLFIQEGTLYGYPQSTVGAHVSACPNHQSGNSVSLENRFNVSACGLLGYELDFSALTGEELDAIKEQIAFYKKHRALIQFGCYDRLDSAFDGGYAGSIVTSSDRREALAFVSVKRKETGLGSDRFFFKSLDPEAVYRVSVRPQTNTRNALTFSAGGSALMTCGVDLGNLFDETDRSLYPNSFASRLIYFKAEDI